MGFIRASMRCEQAIEIAVRYGGFDGDHHKAWAIDQMIRALTGCPKITTYTIDCNGTPYSYEKLGESEEYKKLVSCAGEDGPNTYTWDVGIPP